MKSRPIHQNLDTSFVNLSALVKYLRRRQFVGRVNIQLNGYKAEVLLKRNNRLSVTERDEISGRVSEGEEAFQRVLIRAREPGGSISVHQVVVESGGVTEKPVKKAAAKPALQTLKVKAVKEPVLQAEVMRAATRKPSPAYVVQANNGANGSANGSLKTAVRANTRPKPVENGNAPAINTKPSLPDFPFELENRFEHASRTKKLSTDDWTTLLKLTVELVGVIDRSLANHGLNFAAAFRKARTEISDDFPFMNPSAQIFDYENGRITMTKQVNETIFVASIIESVKRIFDRLGESGKFKEPHREFAHLVIALINKRSAQYDRFGMTGPLRRMLGI